MKQLFFFLIFGITFWNCQTNEKNSVKSEISVINSIDSQIQEADIIFQTSKSSQSIAIQKATHSKYSHMGIIFKNKNEWFVYEAVQPVKYTPLFAWIKRGENSHYVIKRLKNRKDFFTDENVVKMKQQSLLYLEKNYDSLFG